mmetsp:Transcript_41838/g.63987  ORF Transcript_41838/g.63987 Transcript_41838/m.63987 type:complete len:111 (+) Transcript_41838:2838-3170(+)
MQTSINDLNSHPAGSMNQSEDKLQDLQETVNALANDFAKLKKEPEHPNQNGDLEEVQGEVKCHGEQISKLSNKVGSVEESVKTQLTEVVASIAKMQEETEGRDGILLQQN